MICFWTIYIINRRDLFIKTVHIFGDFNIDLLNLKHNIINYFTGTIQRMKSWTDSKYKPNTETDVSNDKKVFKGISKPLMHTLFYFFSMCVFTVNSKMAKIVPAQMWWQTWISKLQTDVIKP